jgi:hypothetical protein
MITSHFKGRFLLGVFALLSHAAGAVLNTTSSFTAIPEAVFVNGSGYGLLQPYTSGSLTITPSFNYASGTLDGLLPRWGTILIS